MSSVTLLPGLLEKIPILLFAGDKDFICNHLGIERLIEALEWNGSMGFGVSTREITPLRALKISTERQDTRLDRKRNRRWNLGRREESHICQGRCRWHLVASRSSSLQVYNSSHMVPYDVPHVAHDMMLRFMGVDFSKISEGTAHIPSSVGSLVKPMFSPIKAVAGPGDTKPPGDDQTKWDGMS